MVTTATTPARREPGLPAAAQLERQIQQGRVLHPGVAGEDVREAQRLLQAHGFSPGRIDGDMGPLTRAAVERFQRSRGIRVDGLIGRETLRELKTPTAGVDARRGPDRGLDAGRDRVPGQSGADLLRRVETDTALRRRAETVAAGSGAPRPGDVRLAPRGMSEREKFDHYASIVRRSGGEVCPGGKPTILGIRGIDIHGNRHESTNNRAYDDTFVVLTADKRVLELRGATTAGQTRSSLVPHVGRINPGHFSATPNGNHNGMPSFHVKTLGGSGRIPGVRDQNDDGRYSSAEIERSRQRGDGLTAILFHAGFADRPKSIGCQTLPPSDMRRLIERVGGRGFSFSLVSAGGP
jgi:peptidoglycan hydrolase-like protein with peptidoglycan-binding domain